MYRERLPSIKVGLEISISWQISSISACVRGTTEPTISASRASALERLLCLIEEVGH